jgi:hypothetical protein
MRDTLADMPASTRHALVGALSALAEDIDAYAAALIDTPQEAD